MKLTSLLVAAILPFLAIAGGAGAIAAPAIRTAAAAAPGSGPFVGIPSSYVYNPRLGSLHDYCTKSPDQFPNPLGHAA